jgi:hypothetical protein
MIPALGAVIAAVLAVVLAGCGCSSPVPSGVQELHVAVGPSEVRLNPATVHAGDVYVAMDVPCTSVGFVWRAQGSVEIAPMSDDDIDRFRHGDMYLTGTSSFDNGTCAPATPNGDRIGECGNVQKTTLVEGKYAFFLYGQDGITPSTVTVLEVVA